MMSGVFPLQLILLLSPPGSTGSASPDITPIVSSQLPSGAGPAFRTRMMDWSPPASAPPPVRPVPARSAAPLPAFSSGFGPRSDPFHGGPAIHAGIDLPGAIGTPVLASAPGKIRFTGRAGGYGLMVEIDHGGGLATRYGHVSRILLRPGMPVAAGQVIALMGSTGRATGSHLHFEVRLHGRPVDPLPYLRATAPFPENKRTYWIAQQQPYLSTFARARAAAATPQEATR